MRKFLIVLVVLALVGLAGDRVAHRLATDEAETRLVAHGLADPTVEVAGFPFLDQLLLRRFDHVRVRATAWRTDAGTAHGVRVHARDVAVPSGGPVTVGRLTGRGTVTYDDVLRRAGVEGLSLEGAGDGTVRLSRDLTVLGRTLAASAVARVEARGQRLRVVPTAVQLEDGGVVEDELAQALVDRFSVDIPLPDLPGGAAITRIVPATDGLVVTVSDGDVSLSGIG